MENINLALALLRQTALEAGYTVKEIEAALDYADRKARRSHPAGRFDGRGRFYADERTSRVLTCRAPSARFPYPEMLAARGAEHVAEVHGVDALHVKRIARLVEPVLEAAAQPFASQHARADIVLMLSQILSGL